MIIGYDYFSFPFQTILPSNNYSKVELKNGKFDEIQIMNSVDEQFTTDKEEWNYNFVLKSPFTNNLEGGDVDTNGQNIDSIVFQKRRKDEDLKWIDVATITYDKAIKLYSTIDKYAQNGVDYEYAFVPVISSVKGNRTIKEITPQYDGIWLTDKTHNYQLEYNIEEGDFEFVNTNAILEPIGSKYPITIYTDTNYVKGSIKALVCSQNLIDEGQNNLNINLERKTRDNLIQFLKNHQPKLLRNADGVVDMLVVNIIGNPKVSVNKDIRHIADVSFEFNECDEFSQDSLTRNNLL